MTSLDQTFARLERACLAGDAAEVDAILAAAKEDDRLKLVNRPMNPNESGFLPHPLCSLPTLPTLPVSHDLGAFNYAERPSQDDFGAFNYAERPSQDDFGAFNYAERPSQDDFGAFAELPSQDDFGAFAGLPSQDDFGSALGFRVGAEDCGDMTLQTPPSEPLVCYLVKRNAVDVVVTLISHGANVNIKDMAGRPLMSCAQTEKMRLAIAEALKQQVKGPEKYERLLERVQSINASSKAQSLINLTMSLYHPDSGVSCEERGSLTVQMLRAISSTPPTSQWRALLKMSESARGFAEAMMVQSQSQSLMERSSPHDVDRLQAMLAAIEAQMAALAPSSTRVDACRKQERERLLAQEAATEALARAQHEYDEACQATQAAEAEVRQQQATCINAHQASKAELIKFQADIAQTLDAVFTAPVSSLNVEQVHMLVVTISGKENLTLQQFQGQELDGELLTQVSMTDLHQMLELAPMGICHRVVHCARMAAYVPNTALLKLDFDRGVSELHLWLQNRGEAIAQRYCHALLVAKVDIYTCGSLERHHMELFNVMPKDRKALVELLHKASLAEEASTPSQASVPASWTRAAQQEVLQRVLEANAELAKRLKQHESRPKDVPEELVCPITMDLMADPVLAEDGHVYDREAIATWLRQTGSSPMTRQHIGNELKPVLVLKNMVEKYLREQ